MGWPFEDVETWVHSALVKLGYTQLQATLGAESVIWLQQRHAPGLAAMAQHVDFLSAYELTPSHGGDGQAQCPIALAASLHSQSMIHSQTFKAVRQPLLLLPVLARIGGSVQWNEFRTQLSQQPLNIEYERKSLRQVLLTEADVQWVASPADDDPHTRAGSEASLATDILPRELVYIKTLQHYAGVLPPPEPLDSIGSSRDTGDTSST